MATTFRKLVPNDSSIEVPGFINIVFERDSDAYRRSRQALSTLGGMLNEGIDAKLKFGADWVRDSQSMIESELDISHLSDREQRIVRYMRENNIGAEAPLAVYFFAPIRLNVLTKSTVAITAKGILALIGPSGGFSKFGEPLPWVSIVVDSDDPKLLGDFQRVFRN